MTPEKIPFPKIIRKSNFQSRNSGPDSKISLWELFTVEADPPKEGVYTDANVCMSQPYAGLYYIMLFRDFSDDDLLNIQCTGEEHELEVHDRIMEILMDGGWRYLKSVFARNNFLGLLST